MKTFFSFRKQPKNTCFDDIKNKLFFEINEVSNFDQMKEVNHKGYCMEHR